jgi:hypothetical protein
MRAIVRGLALMPAVALLLLFAGCSGTTTQEGEEQPSDSKLKDLILPDQKKDVTVPSGTVLAVEFNETLSSASSQVGDRFTARVVDPVSVDGAVVIAPGSTVVGRIVEAVPAKKIGGTARLNLEFTELELRSGADSPISASYHSKAKSQVKKDAATIGGATAGGAILGRIIGHKEGEEARGTAIGAVVGGAVGTGIAASNRGQEVTIPEGMTVQIELDSPLTVSVRA